MARPRTEAIPHVDLRPLLRKAAQWRDPVFATVEAGPGKLVVSYYIDLAEGFVALAVTACGPAAIDRLDLDAARMPAGGLRWLARCPRPGCRWRRRLLLAYLGPGGWGCRRCARAVYATQYMTSAEQAGRRAERVLRLLGSRDPRAILDTPPARPHRMREYRYRALVERAHAAATEWYALQRTGGAAFPRLG